jgi:DHA1 family multidrug resistance protein-like MFS transporter
VSDLSRAIAASPLGRLTRGVALLREQERLLMICIATVLVMAGQGVISPILPLFAKKFGVGTAAVGLTLSTFALARLLLNVPLGAASDRYGRRLLLIGGPLVTALGMIGSGFALNIGQLLAWRFVAGAGSGMYMTGAQIYLVDISTPENRARFIGTNQGALLLGTAIGPAIGGAIAQFFGLRAPFWFVGIGALAAAFYSWARLPETRGPAERHADAEARRARARAGGPPPERRLWWRMMRSRDFAAVSLITMAVFFTRTASRNTLMPVMASARLGMTAGALGAVFTLMSVVNMVLIAPASMVADRFGRKWAIVPSGLLMAGSLLVLGGAHGYGPLLLGAVLLSVGTGFAGPAPAAYAADIAPPELRGLAMGLYRSSGDIGFLIGPPLLGALADATTFAWGFTANAILLAVAALFFLVMARETLQKPAMVTAR